MRWGNYKNLPGQPSGRSSQLSLSRGTCLFGWKCCVELRTITVPGVLDPVADAGPAQQDRYIPLVKQYESFATVPGTALDSAVGRGFPVEEVDYMGEVGDTLP